MTDRRGNTICEKTDRFQFDPPQWWDTEGYAEYLASVRGIRGREVQIREVVTHGRIPTVRLKSKDPVFNAWVKDWHGRSTCYPLNWLKLID